MKSFTILLIISIFFILPAQTIVSSREDGSFRETASTVPGEIIAVSCSEQYPTLGQPVHLIITVQGKAPERFNETITITDEFSGFVLSDGEMEWISGALTMSQTTMTIGRLPRYTRKIPWYPSIVGNHTFHIKTTVSETTFTISVGFDVEGIITPSLGCPAILFKDSSQQLFVTISEERDRTSEPSKILGLELHAIDGTSSYSLSTHTEVWRTWLASGADVSEDDLIVTYDLVNVSDGFYNISVTTTKQSYHWPHAVKIQTSEPNQYTIVQLTDIHIGKYSNIINKKEELIRVFTYLNDQVHPDFVILSGDSVDWFNQRSKRNVYADLQEALLHCDAPVYTTPGNHERYGNSLLFLYFPFTNLTPYHRFLNPLSDYSFTYGAMNYVFLDSGYEFSRWEIQPKIWLLSPEGSGLSTTQMYLLEYRWGKNQMNQIIIMHHPAVNDVNDTGLGALPNDLPSGNNECIAHHRAAFIDYCVAQNVSVVLTGHTHKNKLLDSLGKEPSNASEWPMFVQTRSATLSRQDNGGRVVRIMNSTVVSYAYVAFR